MKKVKTILASILIMLATAFMSACSCSGEDNSNLPQVPVSTISITSDFEKATRDEETGFLTIKCSYGEEFNITYKLGPDNTTRTQVDWDFEGRDDVVATKSNYYTYSQSTTHTVKFVTKSVGNTILKFKPRGTDKWTQATIIVGEAKSAWPTFVAPNGLNYNPTTGKVTWNPVEKMKVGSTIVNVNVNNGIISGLTGYLVNYKNLTTGEEYSTPSDQPIAKCEYELSRGYTYIINVIAKGDDFTTKDSPASENFTFHQLASATELSNNNGEISFRSPQFSDTNEIYYNANDPSKFITRSSNGAENCKFIASEQFPELNEYNLYVISYPKNYAQAKLEGKNYVLDESTGVRYYPSIKTDTLTIQNLIAPTITMTPKRGTLNIEGVNFGSDSSDNNPYLGSVLNWEITGKTYSQDYGVKYAYAIYKGTTKVSPSDKEYNITDNQSLDLESLRENAGVGSYEIKIFACGNSTNTISSKVSTLKFNIQGPMDIGTTSINNTTLKTSEAYSNLFGIELFFLNKEDKTKSLYKFFSAYNDGTLAYDQKYLEINIADIGLASGIYDIYGRFVGISEGTNNLSVTSKLAKINEQNVVVAPTATNISLSKDGVITFAPVTNATNYILNFSQTKGSVTKNFAQEISPANYTSEDGKVTLSVYDVIANYIRENEGLAVDTDVSEKVAEFTSDCKISFTVTTVGQEQSGVNSKASEKITFQRHKMIDVSTVKLNNYVLSFTSPNNSAYVISINGKEYVTEKKSGDITIDLTKATVESGEGVLADFVNQGSSTTITIWAIGSPARPNSEGYINSFAQSKDFACTEVPTDLEMKADGTLLWNLSSNYTTAQNFTFHFYVGDVKKSVSVPSIERLTTEDETLGKYSYDVTEVIDELGSDKTIAISVQHNISDKFSNVESEKYYVIKLSSVALSHAMSGDDPAIQFTTLNTSGLDYTLSITIGENEPNIINYDSMPASTVCTKLVSELGITNVGTYNLRLFASKASTGSNSDVNPFVISSSVTSLEIQIISSQVQAFADGEFVKWNSIHDNATYTLSYKANGESDYVYVMDLETSTPAIFTKDNCKYNLWSLLNAGENSIMVTPAIDYTTTGCILAHDVIASTIEKLATVASIGTSNGKLIYTLSEDLTDYSIIVFADGTKLSNDSYIIDYTNKEITILSSSLVGRKTYTLQVIQSGKISSDISSEFEATKIGTIAKDNLKKSGEWIEFTPVENAEIYELTFKKVGGSDVVSKQIKLDGTDVSIAIINGDSTNWSVDTNLAKYESGLIKVKFTNEFLGADASAGDYTYTVTPYTTISGCLNGNTSLPLKITKLSNTITIGIENENIILSGYVPAGTNEFTSIAYTIVRFENQLVDDLDDEGQPKLDEEGNPIKISKKNIVSTTTGTISYSEDLKTQITGEGSNYKINLNELKDSLGKDLLNGNYDITLVFVGNGNEIISSEPITNENSFEKLNSSTLSTIKGVLSWSAVDSADSYTLKITCDTTGEEPSEEQSEGSEEDTQSVKVNGWLFEITPNELANPQVTEEDLLAIDETFKFEIGKTYKVKVMSNGAGLLSSAWSKEFEIQKLQAPTNIKISATSNTLTYTDANGEVQQINIGDPMLTWSDPNGVTNRLNYIYNLKQEGEDGEDVIIYNTTTDSSELLGQLLPTNLKQGEYEIRMKTIGNSTTGSDKIGLLTSDYSSSDISPIAKYINETASVGFGIDDKQVTTFSWTPVTGAYGYKLTYFNGLNNFENKVYTTYTTSSSYTFRNTEFANSGYYTLLVNAITDPSKAIVSSYSEEGATDVLNSAGLYKAPNVERLMVKDGMFAWGLKIEDIKTFLDPHASIQDDTLIEKFAITGDTSTKKSQLLSKTIEYISKKINNGVEGIAEVDQIISTLYSFKGTINGYEQPIVPTTVDVIRVTGTIDEPVYQTITTDYQDTDLLMFSFDMSTENYTTSEFALKVAPQGNYKSSSDKGLISSVDGKYVAEITAYKPNTPKSWSDAENATQISQGKLLWSLVTNEEFGRTDISEDLKYHKDYKITAVAVDNQETKIVRTVNISDTFDEETGTNPNLKDNYNYFRYLKDGDLFGTIDVATNTNYNLEISVIGTKDSTVLTGDEKAYLNSNTFAYTDILNILENHDSSVTGGEYRWTPCSNMSTATKVVVYGPFTDASGEPIYAPDSSDDSTWKVGETVYATYDLALSAWKNAILDTWTIITNPNATGDDLVLRNSLRHEYSFGEEIDDSGDTITSSRQTTLNLTGKAEYLAGSYIIRKQEIGNGKGIIDTEFSEILVNGDSSIPTFAYEQIATKLGTTTKLSGESLWIKDGKFVWKEVPRANAYKIYLEKIDTASGTEVGNYREVVYTNSFEMPERQEFNNLPEDSGTSYQYRITITATHIESDGRTISPNYFEGENIQTDSYGRAPIPTSLEIDENGVISWNKDTSAGSVNGYEVRINSSNETNYAPTSNKNYDLSAVSSNGTFNFSVRSCGTTEFLNSCFTPQISITKLPKPDVKIVNGVFVWGTESSAEIGEQPTKTLFSLNGGDVEELDIKTGSYILNTEITSYGSDYSASADNTKYPSNAEYTFTIKYQGTSGTVTDTQTNFTIASSQVDLTATKLGIPVLQNVDVQSGSIYENRIRWNAVANAQGYRALVVTQITNSAGNKEDKIFDETFILGSTNNYFVQNADNTFDLRINEVLTNLGITSTQGMSLEVYVQAVGTLDSTTLEASDTKYISGSFSNKKVVEIPSNANNLTYDSETGILSWGFVNPDTESKGHNVQLTTEYDVTNVSEADFNNYWKITSDSYAKAGETAIENPDPTGRSSQIKTRNIEYTSITSTINEETVTTYSIHVVDVIFLVGQENQTPTSYQLTNIGTNYVFKIIVMVGSEEGQGIYKSGTSILDKINNNPISFNLFAFGDGSALLPYGVDNATRLNNVRYFLDRTFVITDDITFQNGTNTTPWAMINDTFTGTIEGNGHKVSYVKPNAISVDYYVLSAFMRENAGTIRNLNMSVNINVVNNDLYSQIEVAGLAITNTGTISNVNIITINNGEIYASGSNTLYTRVAGMVVYNNGTITNSSVEADSIEALDNNSNGNISTKVAGIANINKGTISNTYFDGNIKGNYVSGIANENYSGNIINCYALGIAYVTDADAKTTSDGGKGIQFGGITGSIYGTATIENCYSRMLISVEKNTSNAITTNIGGIVGQIESRKENGVTIVNNITIKNCYVLFKAEITKGSISTNNVNVIAPYSDSASYSVGDSENPSNYYLVEAINDTTNIIPNNTTGVATDAGSISGLVSAMTALKDGEDNAIYIVTVVVDEENSITSKYPLLKSNPEKNPVTNS